LVDHVVMQKRGGVDELDGRREPLMAKALVTAKPRGGHGQHRPQTLASSGDQMSGKLRDERHRTLHALQDQLIDRGHVLRQEGNEIVEVGSRRAAALVQVYYNRQTGFPCLLSTLLIVPEHRG